MALTATLLCDIVVFMDDKFMDDKFLDKWTNQLPKTVSEFYECQVF